MTSKQLMNLELSVLTVKPQTWALPAVLTSLSLSNTAKVSVWDFPVKTSLSAKAGFYLNLREILGSLIKEGLKGKKGYGTPPDSWTPPKEHPGW